MNKKTKHDLINIGTGKDYSVLDYYKHVAEILEFKGTFTFDLSKPTGMKQKLLDVSRINNLGWSSKNSLKSGIKATYLHFLKTFKQIE